MAQPPRSDDHSGSIVVGRTSSLGGNHSSKGPVVDPVEFALTKRLPPSLPRRYFDIYVTNKTKFKVQFDRCNSLLQEGEPEVYLHSLGAAIPRALNLALKIQKAYGSSVRLEVATNTVELTDDFEPLNPAEEGSSDRFARSRHNSAVHIKISLEQ